jgi:hypothetical protein
MAPEKDDMILRLSPVRREKLKRYLDSVVHGHPMEEVVEDGGAAPAPDDAPPADGDTPA